MVVGIVVDKGVMVKVNMDKFENVWLICFVDVLISVIVFCYNEELVIYEIYK